MTIKVEWREDVWAPGVYCDQCGEPIEEHGNALWRPDAEGPVRVYHVHKRCNHDFETDHGGRVAWCWAPLDTHLAYVVHNAKLDLEQGKERIL